jgi:predicted transglutaminase-like cysteine proteinase
MFRAGTLGRLLGGVVLGLASTIVFGTDAFASSGPMPTGGRTSQPIGHYDFCKRMPQECAIVSAKAEPERMTGSLLARLTDVTRSINKVVEPLNDYDIYQKDEHWTYPDKAGDCEDYVLLKRRILIEGGISPSSLLITVVRKPDGEGHAVLTVRTDHGDFVLDNLNNDVRPWEQTGYKYLKRQAVDHTGRWVSIRDGGAPLVGALH